MKPTIPFTAQHGQCLPASVATFFNEPEIIEKFPAIVRGYLMPEITLMIESVSKENRLVADCLCKCKPEDIKANVEMIIPVEPNYGLMIPLFIESINHAFLVVLHAATRDIYWFDPVNEKCGKSTLNAIKFDNTISIWIIRKTVTNDVLGVDKMVLGHLFKSE